MLSLSFYYLVIYTNEKRQGEIKAGSENRITCSTLNNHLENIVSKSKSNNMRLLDFSQEVILNLLFQSNLNGCF